MSVIVEMVAAEVGEGAAFIGMPSARSWSRPWLTTPREATWLIPIRLRPAMLERKVTMSGVVSRSSPGRRPS